MDNNDTGVGESSGEVGEEGMRKKHTHIHTLAVVVVAKLL